MTKKWYIATNTENLIHWMNYGLIFDKQGFKGDSYEVDIMEDEDIPEGYIPCFSTMSLGYALKAAKQSDDNLDSVLLEVDINHSNDMQYWVGRLTDTKVNFYKKISLSRLSTYGDMNCILCLAPLPFSSIKKIILPSDLVKKSMVKHYETKFSKKESLFSVSRSLFKEPKLKDDTANELDFDNEVVPPTKQLDYKKVFAYGGALGLLYYQTKNGRKSTRLFKNIEPLLKVDNKIKASVDSSSKDTDMIESVNSLLSILFIQQNNIADISQVYNIIMERVMGSKGADESRANIKYTLTSDSIPSGYKDKSLNLERWLEKVFVDRTSLSPEDALSTLVERNNEKPNAFDTLAVILSVFFLRDHIDTILKYSRQDFNEDYYGLIAIFFGIAYGFVEIPHEIRQIYDLSDWLSYKMAKYAYNKSHDGLADIALKEPQKPLLIYGDIIKDKPLENYKVKEFYKWLKNKFYQHPINQDNKLIQWVEQFPQEYTVKNNKRYSYEEPKVTATIDIDLFESYVQSLIKQDELFDFNNIIQNYKKYVK